MEIMNTIEREKKTADKPGPLDWIMDKGILDELKIVKNDLNTLRDNVCKIGRASCRERV